MKRGKQMINIDTRIWNLCFTSKSGLDYDDLIKLFPFRHYIQHANTDLFK